ncbi:hypothetical protein INT48_008279 [Thamnidium elegans]|uniref:Uncharacterized protein n=1 Tax=Thamnidium elegans TaxID=101142 RepID=A0A8H7SGC6_9FUNG|nr:hypothetical protein INT48_008279 [Thamnidium elegans]
MAFKYFKDANANDWCIKTAYKDLEREKPSLSTRKILDTIKEELQEYIKADSVDAEKAAAALKILQQ